MVTSSSAALVHSGRANTSQLAGDRAEGSGEVEVEADRVDGQQSTDHDKRRNDMRPCSMAVTLALSLINFANSARIGSPLVGSTTQGCRAEFNRMLSSERAS